jgi:murein L,D-transpeptidase YafK
MVMPPYVWRSRRDATTFASMRRWLFVLFLFSLAAFVTWQWWVRRSNVVKMTELATPAPAEDRVAAARARRGKKVARLCREVGVEYPPHEMFLRAFKAGREIEAWGRSNDGPFHRIASWPVLAASGEPGPKRREGDRQVPEGCYRVAVFNPLSNFHLSLGLDYPNESDRVRSDPQAPGSDIYIHGGAASIGCLALGDDAIEELYLLARDTREPSIPVHIFPARMDGRGWENLRASQPGLMPFWAELAPIYEAFEKTHRVPAVSVQADGSYRLR